MRRGAAGAVQEGAKTGDVKKIEIKLSDAAATENLRGKTVDATLTVKEVKTLRMPELTEEFLHKFGQVPYHVVILEELFSAATPAENESLLAIQRMPMNHRRHAVFVLFGFSLATFNPLQAFQQGVHAVVNPSDMFLLIQLIQKAVADNDLFHLTLREAQKRLA